MNRMLTLLLMLIIPFQAFAHENEMISPTMLVKESGDILNLMKDIALNPAVLGGDESEAMHQLHDLIVANENQLDHYAEHLSKDNPHRAARLKAASEQFFSQVHIFHESLHNKSADKIQQAVVNANAAYKLLGLFLK